MTSSTAHHVLPDAPPAVAASESTTLWIAAQGQVSNLGVYFVCLLACVLVLPVLYALYRCLLLRAHVYELTDQRLRESTGLLSRSTEEIELYRVKDISLEQPFVQRLLGRGRVILRTSDRSTPVVILEAIPDPRAVADLIRDCVERCRVAKGVREID